MSRLVKTRTYNSPGRAAKAKDNREAILRAANELFVADGYAATSIAAIARRAGVSADLIYKAFTNKRRLLTELLNFVVLQDAEARELSDRPGPREIRAERDQRRQVAMLAEDIAAAAERSRPIDDVFRSAAQSDSAVADRHREVHRTRLRNLTKAVGWLEANGPLRDGLTPEQAAATLWMITGPESHRQLVDGLGWSREKWVEWMRSTIEAAVLPPGR